MTNVSWFHGNLNIAVPFSQPHQIQHARACVTHTHYWLGQSASFIFLQICPCCKLKPEPYKYAVIVSPAYFPLAINAYFFMFSFMCSFSFFHLLFLTNSDTLFCMIFLPCIFYSLFILFQHSEQNILNINILYPHINSAASIPRFFRSVSLVI